MGVWRGRRGGLRVGRIGCFKWHVFSWCVRDRDREKYQLPQPLAFTVWSPAYWRLIFPPQLNRIIRSIIRLNGFKYVYNRDTVTISSITVRVGTLELKLYIATERVWMETPISLGILPSMTRVIPGDYGIHN